MPSLLNNRYKIIQTLGSGGFGETFLAEDTHMPSGRRCVIKQLKPVTNNPQVYRLVQERFQREAAILEELGNANNQIPSLYAYFEIADRFYLVQEWIEGVTLTDKVQQQGTLSESSVREILIGILPVLDFVHSKRIVHRDIKPDNIILRQLDGKPVLIDFGAVKETMGTVVNSQGNSTSSIVIGTPGFMPSEQAAGRPVYSSDLYSLGLTAIYLLIGRIPQALETDSRTGEIIWRQHALRISPTLATVLDKAIMSHPRDRFSTARDMLDALKFDASPMPLTLPSPQPIGVSPLPVAAPPQTVPLTPSSSTQGSGKNFILGSLIVGGLIGASIVIGLVLTKTPQSSQVSSSPTLLPTQAVPSQPSSPSVVAPSPVPNQTQFSPSNQSTSIGWIRIGAVNNSSATASAGEPLIASTQPVAISPLVVPSVGTQVTTITGINLRRSQPKPPEYKLADKVSVLQPGQKLVILDVEVFKDPTTSSPYKVVWAEVGLP